jgi:hypothetical protein
MDKPIDFDALRGRQATFPTDPNRYRLALQQIVTTYETAKLSSIADRLVAIAQRALEGPQ